MTESDAIKTIQLDICNGCECIENCITNQCEYFLAINALEEIQQYQALGTVEELRLAKEKQIPMKPTEINDECGYFECPACGDLIYAEGARFEEHKYCLSCGQKLDWR